MSVEVGIPLSAEGFMPESAIVLCNACHRVLMAFRLTGYNPYLLESIVGDEEEDWKHVRYVTIRQLQRRAWCNC